MKTNHHRRDKRTGAFTLMEVMIALGIFFVAVFAILGVITNGLRNARVLQQKSADAGMLAAGLATSNALTEQLESGDFGEVYPNYTWKRDTYEVSTNRLFQIDMLVQNKAAAKSSPATLSILMFRPNSEAGSMDGGIGAGRTPAVRY